MRIYYIGVLSIIIFGCNLYGQNGFKIEYATPQGMVNCGGDSIGKKIICQMTPAMNLQIRKEIRKNQDELIRRGILPHANAPAAPVSFIFPLRQKAGSTDPGFYHIGNYVDRDPTSGILDYNCGARTYDGHNGTDIGIMPFEWYKMDNDIVEVIAGAPGIIVGKPDGSFDRNCTSNSSPWNAVYIQHSDGTIAWYGHLKNGSLTIKNIGDLVVAGEYLGIVGSSGNSTGPHLHFELQTSSNTVIDPWNGSCNSSASWWINQEPYNKSVINKLMTSNAQPSMQCSFDVLNESKNFCSGDLVYYVAGYRDVQIGQTVTHQLFQPDGTEYIDGNGNIPWTQTFSSFSAASWYYYGWFLPNPAQSGIWKYKVTFAGDVYEIYFTVNASVSIASNLGTSICTGSSVTFTATPINGGSTPTYQWKRNGVNAGTNSPTYNTSSLTNGIEVTCQMTSNSTVSCVNNNTVTTSNKLDMTVTSVGTPNIAITSTATGTITSSTSVTFTTAISKGGTAPVYQWKKNNVNVGTNSPTYTSSSWSNGDVVTCVLTSNRLCITANPVTSNSITITTSPKYMTVDVNQNKCYYYDGSLKYLRSHTLSSTIVNGVTNVSDVTVVGSYAYVLDQVNKRIYRSSAYGTLPKTSKVLRTTSGASLITPSGIAISSDSLWILDKGAKAIYRYSLSSAFAASGTLNAAAKITLNSLNANAESLVSSGQYFYVLNNGTTKAIYRYKKSSTSFLISKTLLTNTSGALSSIGGLVVDGSYLRIVDNGLDRTLKYSISSLFSSTGTLNASSNNVLYSSNTNATGITLCSNSNILKEEEIIIPEKTKSDEIIMSAYPNPSSSEVTIRMEGSLASNAMISIFDLSGKLISDQQIMIQDNQFNEVVFDLSRFQAGSYIVRATDGIIIKSIVIEHY